MSDLANKEEIKSRISQYYSTHSTITLPALRKVVSDTPSADLLEYARVMKEYCEKHRNEHNFYMCDTCKYAPSERAAYEYTYGESHKCPFNVPAYWNIPEGEKE